MSIRDGQYPYLYPLLVQKSVVYDRRPVLPVSHMPRSPTRLLPLALSLIALAAMAGYAAGGESAGLTGETVEFQSGDKTLHGLLYKPVGSGPFPALLYNHGSAPGLLSNEAFESIAPALVKRGWAFFAPYRRGQGLSTDAGPYIGDEISRAKATGGLPAAEQIMVQLLSTDHLQDQMAALAWLKSQSFIKADKIAVMGNSFGGIEAVLGAAQGGYCAAVDAAGGAESWDVAPSLQESMKTAVKKSRTPIFFLQAENDYDVTPSRTLYEAMRLAGGTAQIRIYHAFGSSKADGHSFAYRGVTIWKSDVLDFLHRHCH
jgi:carboxymethylenebutenolidase